MTLALPPGGKGPRTLQCLDCDDRPEPLKSDALRWISSELKPPQFEHVVLLLLGALGYEDVKVLGGSGDHGIDVQPYPDG